MLNRYTTRLNLFLFIFTFLIYLLLGAQLFSSIERSTELIIVNEMSKMRRDFLEKYPCVKGLNNRICIRLEYKKTNFCLNLFVFLEDDFESFVGTLVEANKHGVDARTNLTT